MAATAAEDVAALNHNYIEEGLYRKRCDVCCACHTNNNCSILSEIVFLLRPKWHIALIQLVVHVFVVAIYLFFFFKMSPSIHRIWCNHTYFHCTNYFFINISKDVKETCTIGVWEVFSLSWLVVPLVPGFARQLDNQMAAIVCLVGCSFCR